MAHRVGCDVDVDGGAAPTDSGAPRGDVAFPLFVHGGEGGEEVEDVRVKAALLDAGGGDCGDWDAVDGDAVVPIGAGASEGNGGV